VRGVTRGVTGAWGRRRCTRVERLFIFCCQAGSGFRHNYRHVLLKIGLPPVTLPGVLHDVKASDKSIAAGGRDSVKDSETGVSDPYAEQMTRTKAELQAKFAKLQSLALKTKVPGSTQKLALINQHLAVYSETEEVAKILKEMLGDLESRLKIIDTVDEQAKKLVDDTEAKMVEWEKQLVALSNAADKAKEKQASAQLEREKLNGKKKVTHANYDEEKDAYELMVCLFPESFVLAEFVYFFVRRPWVGLRGLGCVVCILWFSPFVSFLCVLRFARSTAPGFPCKL
jgi:hypothetical protein